TNFEGCSQSFWKTHLAAWPTTHQPSDTVGSLFAGLPPRIASLTLLQALRTDGGGLNALTRQGIAAVLNAAHPEVDYPIPETGVVDMVNTAVASGDASTIASATMTLATFNGLGARGFCPRHDDDQGEDEQH